MRSFERKSCFSDGGEQRDGNTVSMLVWPPGVRRGGVDTSHVSSDTWLGSRAGHLQCPGPAVDTVPRSVHGQQARGGGLGGQSAGGALRDWGLRHRHQPGYVNTNLSRKALPSSGIQIEARGMKFYICPCIINTDAGVNSENDPRENL